jgi:cyclophilin family peptidyl-prolyl cis-trans isomerase
MHKLITLLVVFFSGLLFVSIPASAVEMQNLNQAALFTDTDPNSLEGKAAVYLRDLGVIEGFSDNTFRGDLGVNRAETAKFMLLAAQKDLSGGSAPSRFPDVETGVWYTQYINKAAQLDIINGYADGFYRPGNPVNRAEFMKILSLTFDVPSATSSNYADVPSTAWFAPYVGVAATLNLFPNLTKNQFAAQQALTRNEVAVALYLYLKSQAQTPTISATLRTNKGDITLELYPSKTPKTVENFLGLATAGKYNDVPFHRVIEDFMIQGGDYENQNGTGGKSMWGEPFEDEIVPELSHVRGVISMANAGPGTNGSQFFIVHAQDASFLDGRHTVFGAVTQGLEVVDAIARTTTDATDRPLEPIMIRSVQVQN